MQTSVSSNESGDSQASSTRRKSILALFGLSRASKAAVAKTTNTTSAPEQPQRRQPLAVKPPASQQLVPPPPPPQQQQQLANMWTKEQKRAAFDLLAAMNAAEKDAASVAQPGRRQQMRQSVRERNSSLQRNRMRRSLVLGGSGGQPKPLLVASREQMLI